MSEQPQARTEVLRTRDFMGWAVVDRAGEKIGTVDDLLLDRGGRVRFLDVEFGFPRKHVLVPEAQLEWGEQQFAAAGWTREQVRALPPYEPERALDAPLLEEYARAFPWFYGEAPEEDLDAGGATEAHVVPLSEAKEFRLASGAPDLRGWNVFGADGERAGSVAQLLVDPAALKVRYVEVDVLDDLFLLRDDRRVLLPMEHVDLKERGNDMWVRRLRADEVAKLPAYTGGTVEPWLEKSLQRSFH